MPEKAGKVLHALPVGGKTPRIDGRLDDEIWAAADSIDDFVQWEPENMTPLSERTVLQVAYDEGYVYVAVRCYDAQPSRIATGLGRRDDFPPSDVIEIGFDPRHDHLTGFVFQANPSGVQADLSLFDDDRDDPEYDTVWEVATRIGEEGWTAEFGIPFSQMRFDVPPGEEVVWGFDARRTIHRKGEFGQWVGRPRGERGQVSRWGHLVFAEGLSPVRRVELLPFTLTRRADLASGSGAEYALDAGGDLRLGLGSSTTLSATINPDFGQVELDPAVLNLSVFETFFPEKRAFFLEDARTFVPPYFLFQLFHSRRIGREPGRLSLADSDLFVKQPEQTTILGAAKVTGKQSGWTYGALTALSAREYATVDSAPVGDAGAEPQSLTRLERLIEPVTSYSAARVQRDILGGSSNVGALATAVVRERDADAFTGGIDYKIRWDRNRFEWNGHWAATRAPGTGGLKTGFGGVSNLSFQGKNLGLSTHFDHFGRDFRVNDLGFLRDRVDRTAFNASLELSQPDPWWLFRNVSWSLEGGQAWNGESLVFDRWLATNSSMEFRNFWSLGTGVWHSFEVLDDLDTRGGPPILEPAATGAELSLSSDSRRSWNLSLELSGQRDAADGWEASLGPELRLQPSGQLQASMGASYGFGRDAAQWIANRDVNGDGETDHVYGTLRRDVLDVTLRATYALHRDLTLQLYLQPFVAGGDYSAIRRLARPRSFEFEPAALSVNPDFNSKSLRGNLVLRWEYLRGSTLFVVWNLSTFDDSRPGVFTPLQDLADTFGADGTHVLIVKASYWLSL